MTNDKYTPNYQRYLRYSIAILTLLSVVVIPLYSAFKQEQLNAIVNRESRINFEIEARFQKALSEARADIGVLGRLPIFDQQTPDTLSSAVNALKTHFSIFTQEYRHYDQVRFIDTTGMELVRVNWVRNQPYIVPTNELQNKGDRYYFTQGINLAPNVRYVSPLDLNIEHGQIERPLKPMIRFIFPVFNERNERLGMIVTNYHINDLLDELSLLSHNSEVSTAYLLNKNGFFIAGGDPALHWGHLLDNEEANFGTFYPQLWRQMQDVSQGVIEGNNEYFIFSRFSLFERVGDDFQDTLRVVVAVPKSSIGSNGLASAGFFFAIIIVTLALSWLLNWWDRKELMASHTQEISKLQLTLDQVKRDAGIAHVDFDLVAGECEIDHVGASWMGFSVGRETYKLALADYYKLIDESERKSFLAGQMKKIKAGEDYIVDSVTINLPIGRRVIANHCRVMRDDNAKPIAMHALFIDETELKAALQRANTADIAKSDFLSTMSHEIRTPMNGVLGILDLLMRTELSEKQLDLMQKAHFSAHALLRILNDVLDFSKIEAGKLELESVPFDVSALVTATVALFQANAAQNNNTINYFIAPTLADSYIGDPHRIAQVLNNLLSNAIKFTHDGIISLDVKQLQRESGELLLQFSVRDTGIGIAEEQKTKLFKAFSQADSSSTRKYGGTGLGLLISKHLVEAMGGKITVHSEQNVGSEFSFTAAVKEGDTEQTSLAQDNQSKIQLYDGKALLVEDNDINQVVAEQLLIEYGLSVDIANDGAEAVNMADSKPYDIVFMDLHMPNMDGYEATRKIKAAFSDLPVIALSASTAGTLTSDTKHSQFEAHLLKPIERAKLEKVLATFLVSKHHTSD